MNTDDERKKTVMLDIVILELRNVVAKVIKIKIPITERDKPRAQLIKIAILLISI